MAEFVACLLNPLRHDPLARVEQIGEFTEEQFEDEDRSRKERGAGVAITDATGPNQPGCSTGCRRLGGHARCGNLWCREGESNPHGPKAQQILSVPFGTAKSITSSTWVCRARQNIPFRDPKTQPIRNRIDKSFPRSSATGVPFHPGVWATAAKDL